MLALSFETTHPPLSMNMARGSRERVEGSLTSGFLWGFADGCSICLFLAGLLNTLLAGVEGTLLALGGFHHVLLGLGIYKYDQYM
jgi:hypothetical protein